jgi:hypothetical protein
VKRLTPHDFIEKAIAIHGDKYDYSKIKYVYSEKTVPIVCKEHNYEFSPRPHDHLKGSGCPICGKKTKKTTESFIQTAREIHGDEYSYEKVNYINNKTKVVITCETHGDFVQTPSNHIGLKQGCGKCGGTSKLTSEDFIEKAKQIHGDKYHYDKVKYINNRTKVIITCPIHGNFEQSPNSHIDGNGCLKCSGAKKLSKEEFVEKAKQIHGEKYNYDKVKYINNRTKVIIICPIHGDFEQSPTGHLQQGQGCSSCSGKKKKTTEKFIQDAIKIHEKKFSYEKVNYINNSTKVVITCETHGDFEQTPKNHLNGKGCDKCSGTYKITSEKFIEAAKQIHADKYSYDRINFVNTKTKVFITCPSHGDFEQTPNNHLQGQGCSFCSGKKKKNTVEFIEEAKQIHNEKYQYDKVNYVSRKAKVVITCPFHGDFKQAPNNHIQGQGCPRCKTSRGEAEIETVLKKLKIKFETQFTFDDCIDKKKLPFDFAVFINGKIGLIEFHGQQHYDRVYFGNTNEQHEEAKKRDNIKVQYAKNKRISLLIIPYNEIDTIQETVEKFVREKFYGQLETTPK